MVASRLPQSRIASRDILCATMTPTSEPLYEPIEWPQLVLPVAGLSESLRTGLQAKIKASLHQLLHAIARLLPEDDVAQCREAIDELDASRRFAPGLYFAYFGLLQGIARSDRAAILVRYEALRICLHAPYCDAFEVRDSVDEIALSFLQAHRIATRTEASVLDLTTSTMNSDVMEDIDSSVVTTSRRRMTELHATLAQDIPQLANEVASLVSVVQLMPRSFAAEAASSLSAFGMVLVRPPRDLGEQCERLFYFDHVIHEAAHIYLNLLMTFDPLVNNGAELAPSPARQTFRPVKGVLHAHFVFFRLLYAYRNAPESIQQTEAPGGPVAELDRLSLSALPLSYARRKAIYFDKFMQGDAILRSSARFTPRGQYFFDAMREAVCHV
jgi:hypothetical protein